MHALRVGPPRPRRASPGASLAVFTAAAAVLAAHAWYYMPFLCDDALISLRYAQRFLAGEGLTWNPGERVEGYSNLLWVLSAAALGWLGLDLITSVRLLGALGMAATLAAVVYAYPPATWTSALGPLLIALFLSCSGAFAVWSIGGMEQPLVAALLGWAIVLCYPWLEAPRVRWRQLAAPGICLALLCLARPDGPLFVAAIALAVVVIGRGRPGAFGRAIGLAVLPGVFVLGQLAFRLSYYGEWVPNTALVKLEPSIAHTLDGLRYVGTGAIAISPLLLLAAASVAVSMRHRFLRARMLLLCIPAVLWTAYVVVIGGDIFPAWRHLVPLLLLLALMTAIGAQWLDERARPRLRRSMIAAATALLGLFAYLQARDTSNGWALIERWEWDGQVIGRMLRTAFGAQQPLLAVDAAGALPYFSGLPSIDMLGLNDYYLPRHPPTDGRRIGIGHDLGDGQYVLGRRPDLVVFGIATGGEHAFFRSAREMQEDPRFARDYTLVVFEGTDPYPVTAKIWVRRESERIGIRTSAERIEIPGFLMNGHPGSVARLGASNEMVLPFSASQPARLDNLTVPAGRWRIEAAASRAPLIARVARAEPAARDPQRGLLLEAPLPAMLVVPSETHVSIEVVPSDAEPAELAQLLLTRASDRPGS